MVEIGEGNAPGSNWWAIAILADEEADSPDSPFLRVEGMPVITWLTDIPSNPDGQLIFFSPNNTRFVSWPEAKIARGLAALEKAISCVTD